MGFALANGATRETGDFNRECSGGGAWCDSGGILSNCTLTSNAARYGGGSSYGTLINCALMANAAFCGGGSFYGTLINCTLTGNSASYGGGSYYAALNNCTLMANVASTCGGGAYNSTLNNCIVYYNTALQGANWYDGKLYYCYTTPMPTGAGNRTNAPQIASRANPHLLGGSSCIDAGANDYAVGVDVDGQPRIANGTVDIGCDEYTPPCTGALGTAILCAWTNVATGCAIPFEAVVTGVPQRLLWQWGDGSGTTNNFPTPLT
jgi:hypothetical protein